MLLHLDIKSTYRIKDCLNRTNQDYSYRILRLVTTSKYLDIWILRLLISFSVQELAQYILQILIIGV